MPFKHAGCESLEQITSGWMRHFWSADAEIEWLAAETEHQLWLTPDTLLLGRIDAFGKDANGQEFFGEWKTSSTRDKKSWKQTWRLNPQSLTYGVLAQDAHPGCKRFTVRKAFKSDPPTYDHAWYTYTPAELFHWREELIGMANEMRAYLKDGAEPWPTNFSHCFQYGVDYACPFFEIACSKQQWQARPAQSFQRISHLDAERSIQLAPGQIVLDATRVKTWLECRERFRREYMDNIAMPPGEALQLGIGFHDVLGNYYKERVKR